MKEPRFFVCRHCGNVVEQLYDSGVQVVCCGEPMTRLQPGTSDGAAEKHVPACKKEGMILHVQVGEVVHPMQEEHYIGWIWLQTQKGGQRCALASGQEPKADFVLAPGDEAVAVYAWCNIHGLWKADVKG